MYINKNVGTLFSSDDQSIISQSSVCVIGCGGNGGYVIDFLVRLGVGKLILFDGDKFEASNLNRQLGAQYFSLGQNKAEVMKEYCETVNPDVQVEAYPEYFSDKHQSIVAKCDCIFFEADNSHNIVQARECLRQVMLIFHIPVVDGGISPIGGSCSLVTYRDLSLWDTQTVKWKTATSVNLSQPAYLCAMVAAYKVNNFIKYMCRMPHGIQDQFLVIDVLHNKTILSDRYGDI